MSLIAGAAAGFPYPMDDILPRAGGRRCSTSSTTSLPGSGVHATYEYSQGLFQEIQAGRDPDAGASKARFQVNTSFAWGLQGEWTWRQSLGDGIGAGAGTAAFPGGVGAEHGRGDAEPVLVFNQLPWTSEMVFAKIWNKQVADDSRVREDAGKEVRARLWIAATSGVTTTVAFTADVPALGYRTYAPSLRASRVETKGVKVVSLGVIENEFLRVEVRFLRPARSST